MDIPDQVGINIHVAKQKKHLLLSTSLIRSLQYFYKDLVGDLQHYVKGHLNHVSAIFVNFLSWVTYPKILIRFSKTRTGFLLSIVC